VGVSEEILVGISCRPFGVIQLELVVQQRPVFAAANSFRFVEALCVLFIVVGHCGGYEQWPNDFWERSYEGCL